MWMCRRGDRIIVRIMTDENGSYYASVFNYDRGRVLGIFLLLFFALLIFLGGKKGVGALAGLVFTLCAIWFILIPGLIRGTPAIPVTLAITAVTAVGFSDPAERIFPKDLLRGAGLRGRGAGCGSGRRCCGDDYTYEWF